MKIILILFLVCVILFLFYKIFTKNKIKTEEQVEVIKVEFNQEGERLIEKAEFVNLLKQDIIQLFNIIDNIVEKDNDDNITYNNLVKALKILDSDPELISDEYIADIVNLRETVEKEYNLG